MYYYVIAVFNSTKSFTYSYTTPLKIGTLVQIYLKDRLKTGVIVKKVEQPSYDTKSIETVLPYFYDDTALANANFISHYYFCDLGTSLKIFTPSKKGAKNFTLQTKIQAPTLTPLQQDAYEKLLQNDKSLLFGVTGSGKTEVYIQYIYKLLQENKTALILLPEISLTPQIEKRLRSFFGDVVGVWHSKLTKKQKEEFLNRFYEGKIGLVVGARSSLFLPFKALGAIIVDEEHDDSYKANQKPRYHARDMAIYIAHGQNIPIILSSATPTLNSYKKFHVVKLDATYIETKKEYSFINSNEFDEYMLAQLRQNANDQSIVFLPTRGNFKYLKCATCGEFVQCPFCSVGMSIHIKSNALKCHYCNYAAAIPQTCPSCHELSLSSQRIGTAQVMQEMQNTQELTPLQFDTDTITTNNKLKKALQQFEQGKNNVLVGTQMLSKGHDYPNVTLSMILGLDYLLAQADFRAREKALSLFFQIAGRCGRNKSAKVIAQTANADFFKTYLNDYEKFLKEEDSFRKELYPPYKTLAKLMFAHRFQNKAQQQMEKVLQKLENIDIEVVGYGPNMIEKIANRYRFHILLRSDGKKQMQNAIAKVYDGTFEVDMDCIHFD